MNLAIYFDKELLGKASYYSLVSLSLFCEQFGLDMIRSESEPKVEIFPRSNQETINVISSSNTKLSMNIVDNLKKILLADGIDTSSEEINNLSSNKKPSMFIDIVESRSGVIPHIIIEHHVHFNEKMKNILSTELNKGKILCQFKEEKRQPIFSKQHLQFKCVVNPEKINQEIATFSLARAITLFLNLRVNKYRNLPNYTPKPVIKSLLKSFVESDYSTPHRNFENVDRGIDKISNSELKEELHSPNVDLFLDYTVLLPKSDEKNEDVLINGSLVIKNNDSIPISNPVICVKTPTQAGVSLQGPFIPPKLVPGLAMKSSAGDKGWMYVYDDWREKSKTKGEYWVKPIQDLVIQPGDTFKLNGLNLLLKKTKEKNAIIVQSFVYLNNGKHQFISNNSISVSY
jgi:hypothetical protein